MIDMMQLNERFRFEKYNVKEILICDFSDLKGEDFIEKIKYFGEFIKNSGKNDILMFNDVRNCTMGTQVMNALKKTSVIINPYLKSVAVVGVTGMKKHFFTVVIKISKMNAKAFETEEEAKNFLIS